MTDIPIGIYYAHRDLEFIKDLIPKEMTHFCIDNNPLAELVLRLTLSLSYLSVSEVPRLFGYSKDASFYFFNEEQHKYIQSIKGNKDKPCGDK